MCALPASSIACTAPASTNTHPCLSSDEQRWRTLLAITQSSWFTSSALHNVRGHSSTRLTISFSRCGCMANGTRSSPASCSSSSRSNAPTSSSRGWVGNSLLGCCTAFTPAMCCSDRQSLAPSKAACAPHDRPATARTHHVLGIRFGPSLRCERTHVLWPRREGSSVCRRCRWRSAVRLVLLLRDGGNRKHCGVCRAATPPVRCSETWTTVPERVSPRYALPAECDCADMSRQCGSRGPEHSLHRGIPVCRLECCDGAPHSNQPGRL